MAFIQISESDANRFIDFLLDSGAWARSPAGQWEAFRLTKVRKTDPTESVHSPLDTLVIHKNKKGIHSFDPLHIRAFEYSAMSLSPPLESRFDDLMAQAEERIDAGAFLRELREMLQTFSPNYRIETVNTRESEIFITFAIPATRLMGWEES